MRQELRDVLRKNNEHLVRYVVLTIQLWCMLLEEGVVSRQDKDEIERENTRETQVGCLLEKLMSRSDDAYKSFRGCLEESEQRDVVRDYLPAEPLTEKKSQQKPSPPPTAEDGRERIC